MKIAKIIGSNSHIEYIARILDSLDVSSPPASSDYTLGKFIRIEVNSYSVIGVIANSQLINPEYGNIGPRLSSQKENNLFSPDYLHDQGIMISIILLGYIQNNIAIHQSPIEILPVQSEVFLLSQDKIELFHRDKLGNLRIGYYSQLAKTAGAMSKALLLSIINQLEAFVSSKEMRKIALLKQNLNWQETLSVFER
jgi:hypothetical protein